MSNACAWWAGDLKNEVIVLGMNKIHAVPPATIVKHLLEIEDSVWSELELILKSIDTLSEVLRFYCERNVSLNEFDESNLRFYFEKIFNIRRLLAPVLLSDLVLLLPALYGYALARDNYLGLPGTMFIKIYRDRKLEGNKTRPDKYKYKNELSPIHLYFAWEKWFALLASTSETLECDWPAFRTNELARVVFEYTINLRAVCHEAKVLASTLHHYVNEANETTFGIKLEEACQLFSVYAGPCNEAQNSRRLIERMNNMDCSVELSKNRTVFTTNSLAALVIKELKFAQENKLILKKCEFCGGYYWTRKSNSIYCKYPNTKLEGRTCQEVAPTETYLGKSNMRSEYRSNCAKYSKWISRICEQNDARKLKYILDIEEDQRKDTEEKTPLSKAQKEMRRLHSSWLNEAWEALQKYERNEISEAECRELMTLPSVENRSPILAKLREDLRCKNGISKET